MPADASVTSPSSSPSLQRCRRGCFLLLIVLMVLSVGILQRNFLLSTVSRILPQGKHGDGHSMTAGTGLRPLSSEKNGTLNPVSSIPGQGKHGDGHSVTAGTGLRPLSSEKNGTLNPFSSIPGQGKHGDGHSMTAGTGLRSLSSEKNGTLNQVSSIPGQAGGKTSKEPAKASNSQSNISRTQMPAADLKEELQACPEKPTIAENKVALNLTEVTYEELARKFGHVLRKGGYYSPSACKARERVALIIPYRDRERNLHILLNNLIPFLIRQQLEFTIFVVEQTPDYRFNRCLMFNVGYVESQKRGRFTCFILHDTDLIPRDNRNLYRCHARPRHLVLSRSNEHWQEKLPYLSFIGGGVALRKEHMNKSNGCSNSYYGWGLEDDDLGIRLSSHGFPVVRYPMEIAGYYSLDHKKQTDNPARGKLVKTIRSRMRKEGLNTLNYTLVQAQEKDIFTWLLVKPPPPPNL